MSSKLSKLGLLLEFIFAVSVFASSLVLIGNAIVVGDYYVSVVLMYFMLFVIKLPYNRLSKELKRLISYVDGRLP